MGTGLLKGKKAGAISHALAGASLIALVTPSYAADLPITKVPFPVPVPSWAGFYLGIHGGYGRAKDDFSDPFRLVTDTFYPINGIRGQAGLYGAHAGYNWQFGHAVTGLEFDFSQTDIKGSNGVSETAVVPVQGLSTESVTLRQSLHDLGSARARLGWLPADNLLVYGTAGLGWGRYDWTLEDTNSNALGTFFESSRSPFTRLGWVAGLGTEFMLGSSNWIGRAEYLHYQFGSMFGPSQNVTADDATVDVVRAGVSFKFNDSGRVAPALYAKAPLTTAPAGWAGFYLGAHGGYAWGDDPLTAPMAVFAGGSDIIHGTSSRGWIAGGHFGYNWQYDRVVAGLEADLSGADIKGTTSVGTFGTRSIAFDEKVRYLGTLRGRLGFTPMSNILLYGTAGLAWERFDRGETDTTSAPAGVTVTRTTTPSDPFGWVAGVGGEIMLGGTNWIGRLEYLHYDFGHVLPDFVEDAAVTSAGHQRIDLVRAGVSYKLGPAAPVTALAMVGKAAVPPLQSWAGFYLGAHAGYGWKDNDLASQILGTNGVFPIGGIRSQGWVAGGHVGYNWQYTSLVAGIEIDGTATGISGRSQQVALQRTPPAPADETIVLSDDVKYLGTVRARVGWTPASGWLIYGTGGLAWERADRTRSTVVTGGPAVLTSEGVTPRDQFGWVAGAGAETFIGGSSWIARLEYLHYDFGTVEPTSSVTSTVPGAFQSVDRGGHQTIETVRAGLSYKFTP